eukprot:363768-Chlamydomonas_euryale.AAC.3
MTTWGQPLGSRDDALGCGRMTCGVDDNLGLLFESRDDALGCGRMPCGVDDNLGLLFESKDDALLKMEHSMHGATAFGDWHRTLRQTVKRTAVLGGKRGGARV